MKCVICVVADVRVSTTFLTLQCPMFDALDALNICRIYGKSATVSYSDTDPSGSIFNYCHINPTKFEPWPELCSF